ARISALLLLASTSIWIRSEHTGEYFSQRTFNETTRVYRVFNIAWSSGFIEIAYQRSDLRAPVDHSRFLPVWMHNVFAPTHETGWWKYEARRGILTPRVCLPPRSWIVGMH